jgi:hypothetical protein
MHTPILTLIEQAAQEGIREAAKATLKRARELSPTDTGASDKTGFVVVDDLTAQVGFTSPISRIQHEDLDNEHPAGGQAKFLEAAAAEVTAQTIAVGVGKRIARG